MSKKYHYVYQTKNIVTGKTYIGIHSTNNLADGYIGHGVKSQSDIESYKRCGVNGREFGSYFVRSMIKYGYDSFKKEILDFYDTRKDILEEERFLVDEKWVKDPSNYNTALGGNGGFPKIHLDKYPSIREDYLGGMLVKNLYKKYNICPKIVAEALSSIDKSKVDSEARFIKKYSHLVPQVRQLSSTRMTKTEMFKVLKITPQSLERLMMLFNIEFNPQIYVAVHKNGVVEDFTSATEFAKKYNLPPTGISDLIYGKSTTYRGWAAIKKEAYSSDTFVYPIRYSDRYIGSILLDPDGVTHTLNTTLVEFSKEHSISVTGVMNLMSGRITSTKGWTRISKS
jgi:predicted transcriptional regulator